MQQNSTDHYDILIVGGGPVGISLTLALADTHLRVGLIEAQAPVATHIINHEEDLRALALSFASLRILTNLGLGSLLAEYLTPIKKIHISEQKRFASVLLDANAMGVSEFAAVIPIAILVNILQHALSTKKSIDLLRPAEVTAIKSIDDSWMLTVNNQLITSKLIIAADGSQSFLRQQLQIPIEHEDYGQSALLTNIQLKQSHDNTAYERFFKNGSMALMPLSHQRCGLIWMNPHEISENLLQLPEKEFIATAQREFGYRLGRFQKIGKRQLYPLQKIFVKEQVQKGFVLLGNAAHTLHPIGAQNLNLALRDVAQLAELLIENTTSPGDIELLKKYLKLREADQQQTLKFTEQVLQLFSAQQFPMTKLRNTGLMIFDLMPFAKRRFSYQRMGMTGHLSKYIRAII